MSTTRSMRPTDLVALVSLDGRVYPNEARTWDRLGCKPEGPRLLENALEPWFSFATGRHTWITIQGQTIRGLVSARKRGHRSVWEIDCLVAASDDERALVNLFEQVSGGAGRAGVLKIFLRLDAGSDLLAPARRAGFVPYLDEMLLRLDEEHVPEALPAGLETRPRVAADGFALYRLYNAAIPEHVRRMEAATFQQWQAAEERRTCGRTTRDLVVLRAGELVARVRASREGSLSRIDLMIHPAARACAGALLSLAAAQAGDRRPLLCLVPGHTGWLAERLRETGFALDGEFIVLVKRTALPLAALKPVRAPAAVPHSAALA